MLPIDQRLSGQARPERGDAACRAPGAVGCGDQDRAAGRSMPGSRPTRTSASPPTRSASRSRPTSTAQFGEATAFMNPEILAVGRTEDRGVPRRRQGARQVPLRDRGRAACQAPHTLGAEAEGVIAATAVRRFRGRARSSSSSAPRTSRGRPSRFPTAASVRLDDQGYELHRDAPNRADRKLVFDRFWGELRAVPELARRQPRPRR